MAELRRQYGCGPVEFTGTDNALYERHLFFDNVIDLTSVGPRERFEAFARSVRDILSQRWVLTEDTYERENPKYSSSRLGIQISGCKCGGCGHDLRHGLRGPVEGMCLLIPFTDELFKLRTQMVF
jgi:hypothetical protein